MSKTVMRIALLAISLVFMVGITEACHTCISGSPITGCTGCSVEVADILKGLGSADNNNPSYEVVLVLQKVTVFYVNPANNTETAKGTPFTDVLLVDVATGDEFIILRNGRTLADIVFHDEDIIQVLLDAGEITETIKNDWTLVRDKAIVNEMEVFGTLFFCEATGDPDNPRGICAFQDDLGRQCSVPTGDLSARGTTYNYDCTTICSTPDDPCPLNL